MEPRLTTQPVIALAPMADVTDAAFRRTIAHFKAPDIMWTEFVSADGLYHTREIQHLPDEKNPLMRTLVYSEKEHPIIAQIFTARPEMAEYAATLVADLGFDGVDINMGCPDRSVMRQGAGGALMRTPALARTLIQALKRGAGERIPVSVKTRVGDTKNELATWLPELLAEGPARVTIHARTRKDLSKVPAQWEYVREAVQLRDALGSTTSIFGNGDVRTLDEAYERAIETGADGVMVGRAIFGTPWLFAHPTKYAPTAGERINALLIHLANWEELMTHKPFALMKKHIHAYLQGFSGARALRTSLMNIDTSNTARALLKEYLVGIQAP